MMIDVCPRCGSTDTSVFVITATDARRCNNCGYTGICLEVDENDLEKVQADIRKNLK